MHQQKPNTLNYRPEIDGLRALAVLSVVLYHADLGIPGGYIGVDVFFVISGYLITRILQKRKSKHGYSFKYAIYEFYIARTKRIIPAYYVMLLFVGVACSLLLTHKDFQYFNESFLSYTSIHTEIGKNNRSAHQNPIR